MTREEALKEADAALLQLLATGDEALFAAATDMTGNVDVSRLASAAMRARERLADSIMSESRAASGDGKRNTA